MASLIEGYVSHLGDSSMDIRSKLNVATELRDAVEINQVTAEQDLFVAQLLPAIIELLEQVSVSMLAVSPEHKLRHTLLDVLARLQPTEVLRPMAVQLFELALRVIQVDNEENGIICMKIITNLHRGFKADLAGPITSFLELVIQLMQNVPSMVHDLFNAPAQKEGITKEEQSSASAAGTPETPNIGSTVAPNPTHLFKASRSFKVLTECPIIIVMMFTSHPQVNAQEMPKLLPHVIEVLSLEAAPQAKEHAAAASRGTYFTGVAPALRQGPYRHAYNDFVLAQIKSMSFISFVVRSSSQVLQPHMNLLPAYVVRLLKDCPSEMSSARRELLVSMRHLMSTEHRTYFLSKISMLLEERILIGCGLTAYENLRPLAYSTISELIFHIRGEMSTAQCWQAVRVYTGVLLDPTLSTNYQSVSLKLLINVMDRVSQGPEQGRQIIMLVLRAVVERMAQLNRHHSELEKALRRSGNVIHSSPEFPPVSQKDLRIMFRNLVFFTRNTFFSLKQTNPPAMQGVPFSQWQELARVFNLDSVEILRALFREGLKAFSIFGDDAAGARDLMNAFAGLFMVLDPATFNEMFDDVLEEIYNAIVHNNALFNLTYMLTANEATSPGFCGLMLKFLMERLSQVGEPGGQVLLKLFKQCFAAVNLFPPANESVILPHLRTLVVDSLALANDASEPSRYFILLQYLFRTLGGGRFDTIYKSVLPLLHHLLETLNRRLEVARKDEEKDMYAELCLTVPVRLSLMVPHLSFLMRPLAHALSAKNNSEVVSQGLRTLELCVDNLTAAYFDPHIEPVLSEVMPALWSLLRPLPYDHKLAHNTLRVLGKLGGRSRAYISPPSDLRAISALDQDVAVHLQMDVNTEVPVRITPALKVALRILESPIESGYRRDAFRLVTAVLQKFIPSNTEGLDVAAVQAAVRGHVNAEEFTGKLELPESQIDKDTRQIETELAELMLRGVFYACADESLRPEALELLNELCEHFVLLELGEFNIERRRALRPFNLDEHEGLLHVPPRTFVAAIVYALSHHLPGVPDAGIQAIRKITATGRMLCGEAVEAHRYPLVRGLFAKLSHACFEEEWYMKRGAVTGLGILFREASLPKTWLAQRLVELARTLFFVIKDTSPVGASSSGIVPSAVSQEAADLMIYMISQLDHTPNDRYFALLTSLLAYELESACEFSRKTAQRALRYLADHTNLGLSEILHRVTEVFLSPIFMKPLRALPFPMQIGYIDAISFCLGLPDTFLIFNDKLTRLLEEALALVDAEDESLTSAHRVFEYTTSQQLTELRVVCIGLLALAITRSDHLATRYPSLRAKIIAVFFKTMASGSPPAVSAAYDGLKVVLQVSHKLPKELLQAGLKPILLPLSDYKRLSVNVLDCLARLLELLTCNFKVEIGTKLLDHLRTFASPQRLMPLSNRVLDSDDHIAIGVALINVFHMLPPTAHVFIPQLIELVVHIEEILRRSQSSPFRKPTAKFLDRYPTESFAYFADRLIDPVQGRFFVDMLKRAPALAKYTEDNIEELCGRIMAQGREEDQCVGICNLIHVVRVVKPPRRVILNLISSVGDVVRATASLPVNMPLHVSVPQAISELQHVVVTYLKDETRDDREPMDLDLIMTVIDSLASAHAAFAPHLMLYLYDAIALGPIDVKKKWLDAAIESATQPTLHPKAKKYLMQVVNVVLVEHARIHGSLETLVDSWLKRVHEQVWQNAAALMPSEGSADNPLGSGLGTTTLDHFFLQLLEMSVLLVQHAAPQIVDVRKDVIKFGWRYITVEDTVSKLSAYVLVNYFVAAFDTLPKIVVQIYIALLKSSQHEGRPLVQQALDVLASVIKQRINSPLWARAPRRILSEDGHGILGVSNVCLFLARHAKLFYPYRELYVQFIVSAMARVSVMSSQTLDVDLAELLAEWERERYATKSEKAATIENATDNEDVMEVDSEQHDESKEEVNEGAAEKAETTEKLDDSDKTEKDAGGYEIPHHLREAVITYLVRFITTQSSRARDPRQSQRVLAALDTLLEYWSDVEVQLHFFDRVLMQTDFTTPQQNLSAAIDALAVVRLALKHKPKDWVTGRMEELVALLEKAIQCPIPQVHTAVEPVLRLVLKADPEETMLRVVVASVTEHLNPQPLSRGARTGQNGSTVSQAPRNVWISLASEAIRAKPNSLDEQMPQIIKALSRMAKDRVEGSNEINASQLIHGLGLVASRVSHLGDQRRSFLSLVANLVERVPDKQIGAYILDMVREWVFGNEPFPTTKEKAAILHKLLAYSESQLAQQYFDIVIAVFMDPRLRSTELPARLEQPFLVGCTSSKPEVRGPLLKILDESVDRTVAKRLIYVLTEQSWEALADHNWLCQALQLVLAPFKKGKPLQADIPVGFPPVSVLQHSQRSDPDAMEADATDGITEFVERRHKFLHHVGSVSAEEFITPLHSLLFENSNLVHEAWIDVFAAIYTNAFAEKQRHELVQGVVTLLTREYHLRQADKRPNVIQTLLAGLAKAGEQVPPQLAKYLATNYDAWYTAIQICEDIRANPRSDSPKVAETNDDALTELYAALGEDDHFYGLWRTRSKFHITSAALSYEQIGMWNRAMQLHETAQVRARSGVLPFGESEYGLWEDHWILCAEKLQHWEILTDIAKHEGFTDLLLECQWRLADWLADRDSLETTIKMVMDVPTPRRQVFDTFLTLQSFAQKTNTLQQLSQDADEGIQLSLRSWHALPHRATNAHVPLLHEFQQYIEFMEAMQVYTSLQATTALNLEAKSQELKGVMQAWHERLPNTWDDINLWGDLAAWRQHVFGVINRIYLPLIPQLQASQGANGNSNNSAAYRGYHEIAWTINRFAHVARKQNLPDVCVTQLSKIYTLPNIEIQEAFLKLREQAKCHLQNPNELATGLDVISNTNLAFFGNPQKSEFFALKGESLAKLGQDEHANSAFSTAVQIDVYLPKAWAAWGEFNDRRFKNHPDDYGAGAAAVVCYLHAAGLYKNRKARKLIGRLLWLLALDDAQGRISQAFENYKGDIPTWYWVTFIPQLLTSLTQREAKFTSRILIKIAKAFPQALHFHLRTAREEYALLHRFLQRREAQSNQQQQQPNSSGGNATSENSSSSGSGSSLNNTGSSAGSQTQGTPHSTSLGTPQISQAASPQSGTPQFPGEYQQQSQAQQQQTGQGSGSNGQTKQTSGTQSWDYAEEIMGVLKTAYPLLALSLETLIDQMHHRFKSPPDEDAYRLIVALLNDGVGYVGRQQGSREDQKLPPHTEANLSRFAEGVIPESTKPQFEADFVHPRPSLDAYIARLRKWRNRLEAKLDARPFRVNLEAMSPPLGEFHYQKFEDIEVPSQNLELKDDNHYFLKIGRFVPHVDMVRGFGICYRRITIHATDGSFHPFAVQYPAARNCRREERMSQVFKILNSVLSRRSEARRRNLQFTLPNAVPLNTHIRLVQDDPRYTSFYQIYEKYCRKKGQSRDAPFDYTIEQLRIAHDPNLPKPDLMSTKMEIIAGVQSKFVPSTIMRDFFIEQFRTYEDFWLFRKQFAYQYAAVSFMTTMMSVNNRYPHKFLVNMSSGNVWAAEMLPILPQIKATPTYLSGEPVAFRLTPNIQTAMSQPVMEGVFAPTMMVIARGLSEPEFDLQEFLPVFVRDELIAWFTHHLPAAQRPPPKGSPAEQQLLEIINSNVESIARRAGSLAQIGHSNPVANQTALDLISLAVNPRNLANTDILWMPYY